MSSSDQRRAKEPPPADDDPLLRRTCNRCSTVRNWVVSYCPKCGSAEFRLAPGAIEAFEERKKAGTR